MKKLLLFLLLPAMAGVAFLIWQNLPEKRFGRHMIKARLYAKEKNLTAARLEYEKAYNITGEYTPYASVEVLELTNRMNLLEKKPEDALANSQAFVKRFPTNKEGRMILARLAFEAGDFETGFASLDAILEKDPGHFPARTLLAAVRTRQGRFDLAEEQLRFLYGKYPDSARSLLPLSELLLKQGRTGESRGFLAGVLKTEPKNSTARILIVDSYLREEKIDSAQAALDAWKAADPTMTRDLEIRKARLYSLGNRLEEAKSALAPYLEHKPDNIPALSELAILHAKGGRYDSAVLIYRDIGEISPAARGNSEYQTFYLHLANQNPARALETLKGLLIADKRSSLLPPLVASYMAIGQDFKADEVIEKQGDTLRAALAEFKAQLDPSKEFIGEWGRMSYFKMNQQEHWAFQSVENMYRRWPANRIAIMLYAAELSSRRRFADAAKVLAAAGRLDLQQQSMLIELLAKSGQVDKAISLAAKAAAENPSARGLNLLLGDFWFRKDRNKSVQYYQQELAVNPENVVALNNLAWEFGVVRGDRALAAPYLEKLKAHNQMDPRILDTIGWILALHSQGAEGGEYIRKALILVPDYPSYLYHEAFILRHKGQAAEARKRLEAALSSKQPFEERKDAEKLLSEMG